MKQADTLNSLIEVIEDRRSEEERREGPDSRRANPMPDHISPSERDRRVKVRRVKDQIKKAGRDDFKKKHREE